jgi:hypothetical protein
MTVVDGVGGVTYRHGTPVRTLGELEGPLAEAAFVEKAEDQNNASADADANQPGTASPLAHAPASRATRVGALLGLVVLVIACAGYAGYRRTLTRTVPGGKP